MTYTDTESCLEDGINNNEEDEDWLNTSLSHDENDNLEEDEEDTQNTTLVASTSAKKSLMKLFSPDKLPLRKLQMETDQEKLSPMDVSDISSPDSHKSISEELTVSMTSSAFSLSEDSLTYIVRASGAKDEVREVREEEDSLDEISSGEISEEERGAESEDRQSNVSQNLSELWDDERYLSEYNYDEELDEDRAKRLLNFGDDYRAFIDSLSESQQSLASMSLERRHKRAQRMRKKTLPAQHYDTQSEAESCDNLSSVLVDSEREISRVTSSLDLCHAEGGFIRPECYNQYNDLKSICQDNLAIIIDCLQSAELQDTFVSKKKSRDLRVLLNKWEKLLVKIGENIQHTEVYESLRNDIVSLRLDLTKVLEERDNAEDDTEDDVELEQKLLTFRGAMSQLCEFKSQLFNLNLSVHNFLAELHCNSSGSKRKFSGASHLKEDVSDLYRLWDRAHHNTVANITRTEDLLAKLRMFETEVVELRSLMTEDRRKILRNRKSGTGSSRGSVTSGDSGISDDSGDWVTDSDERLAKLRMIADNLRRNLPPDSPSLQLVDRTLQTTSDQLESLQRSFDTRRLKQKPKPKLLSSRDKQSIVQSDQSHEVVSAHDGHDDDDTRVTVLTSPQVTWRRKVVRMALLTNFLLFLTAVLCWICQPKCCENQNTMYLLPKLTYVNGPPPI